MRLYIAGPMRGYPEFNFPAFHRMEAKLRLMGYEVVSPASMDLKLDPETTTPEGMKRAEKLGLRYYMKRDMAALLECDGIVLLDGWEQSVGATLEAHAAQACGLKLFIMGKTALVQINVDIGLRSGDDD